MAVQYSFFFFFLHSERTQFIFTIVLRYLVDAINQMSNLVGIFSLYCEAVLGQSFCSHNTEFRAQEKRREKNKRTNFMWSRYLAYSWMTVRYSEESCRGIYITHLYTALRNATVKFRIQFLENQRLCQEHAA